MLDTVLALVGFVAEGLRSVAPIIGILLVILRTPLENWREITVGLVLTVVGLVVFLKVLEIGLTPLEEAASEVLAQRRSMSLLVA